MPSLVRSFVKAAFVWLVVALGMKSLALLPAGASLPAIVPVSWHLLFVGWLMQFIFGIAHWMLPTRPGARKAQLRGDERLMWGVFVLLNLGLALRMVAEPLHLIQPGPLWTVLLVASAWLQWLAGVGFVANSWQRARAPVRRGKRSS
jgi:hypothetical protein